MAQRAGFIGLGDMGKPMALRLVGAGFATAVHDLAEAPMKELAAAGAHAARSPREVAEASEHVGICVPEDSHVRAVMTGERGVLAGAASGTVVSLHSTILPSTAEEMAALGRERGVQVLDACVTGGAARASQGKLTYLVGGDAATLERARPFLASSGEKLVHAGPLGSGCKLKLCINLITYLQWIAAYESAALARAVGLAQETLEEAGRSNGQLTDLMLAYLTTQKAPEAARKHEAFQKMMRGHMKTAEKDLAWVLKLAREAEVALPGAALASQLMARIYGVEDAGRR